jgi:hypothetical protein
MWDGSIKGKKAMEWSDFVILGAEAGDILFADIRTKNHYYTRVHFHSSAV